MRIVGLVAAVCLAGAASAESVVFIPLDNRPATGQYSEYVARIGGLQVITPPLVMLGNYTIAGSPDSILDWLGKQDLSDCRAIIASTDMVAYGSLFESRKGTTDLGVAKQRLSRLLALRAKAPQAKLYLYSAIMRLTPSATHDQGSYRLALARYVQGRSAGKPSEDLEALKQQIPEGALAEYDATRKRNHEFQRHLIGIASQKSVDLVVLGQDDAAADGPHVEERKALSSLIEKSGVASKVRFCEGIDQVPSVLASRAVLAGGSWRPKVRVVYSSPDGDRKVAQFETQSLARTVSDQVVTAGAQVSSNDADYTLYVNTPERPHGTFMTFLNRLRADIDASKPVAIADVNLSRTSAAPDPELYAAFGEQGKPLRLLSYSAWNTAANTIGTSVAVANAYLATQHRGEDSLETEVAHKEFMLLRLANDYAYHTFTRPVAFQMTEGPREEAIFGKDFYDVNDYVQRDLAKFLRKAFFENFLGRSFKVGDVEHEFIGMSDLVLGLPWPRPYEVRLEFQLIARPSG